VFKIFNLVIVLLINQTHKIVSSYDDKIKLIEGTVIPEVSKEISD